jgi:hypothetical protein
VTLGRLRLQHDLETALEVEAEVRLAVHGRARDGEKAHSDEECCDEPE